MSKQHHFYVVVASNGVPCSGVADCLGEAEFKCSWGMNTQGAREAYHYPSDSVGRQTGERVDVFAREATPA